MTYLGLTELTPNTRVSEASAFHDRINVHIGEWSVGPCQSSDVWSLLTALSTFGDAPLFARPTGARAGARRTLVIRSPGNGRGLSVGRPLIAGLLRVRQGASIGRAIPSGRVDAESSAVRFWTLTVEATLNVSRYLHHQPHMPWVRMAHADWQEEMPILETGHAILSTRRERSIDRDDNVLLTRAQRLYAGIAPRDYHLSRYWRGVIDRLDSLFHQHTENLSLPLRRHPRHNLLEAETYWEFLAQDPVAYVASIERHLVSIGLNSKSREYPYGDASRATDGNSITVRVRLTSGVWLRVYAKTDMRVRFEIEHDFRSAPGPLRALGGHTTTSDEQLITWVSAIRRDAAEKINAVLAQMHRTMPTGSMHYSLTQLMFRVASASPTLASVEYILTKLAMNGFISPTGNPVLRNSAEILVKVGVLNRPLPRGRKYTLHASYCDAAERLAAALKAPRKQQAR